MNTFLKNTCRILIACAALIVISSHANSQSKDIPKELFNASTIPDSLKENANAVVRFSNDDIIVKAPGKSVYKHHILVTILNEKAEDKAEEVIGYNKKYDYVSSFEMKVYNATGTLIKKYSKSDMYDRAAVDEMTIVTDDRYLAIRHVIASYPTTVEISFETDNNSFMSLPTWYMQDPEVAVQKATCKVAVNPAVGFRYKAYNVNLKATKGTEDNLETYTWEVNNLKAIKPEEDVPSWCITKKIAFVSNQFQFFGLPGDLSSWTGFGKWIQGLNADICSLSPQREEEIRKMTENLKTDKEKARFLYNYLQQNVRYVSIQLGIGGFKPFAASFVDQKKYGDCKALSNYMYALLKAVNVPSYYAVINAGTNGEPADLSFPYDSFNHAILCVPLKGDTTWLECTSNTQAFGKLGPFTENRRALLITEDGGKLVNTPKSNMDDNTLTSNVHIALNPDGGAKAEVMISSTGEDRSLYIDRLPTISTDKQKEYLIRHYNMKQPSVFNYISGEDKEGVKEVKLVLEYDKFCDVSAGDKQFYRPQAFDLWTTTIPAADKRISDFYFHNPTKKICTTTIDLPEGFEVESLPSNVSLKFTYGSYDVNYQYDATKHQVISVTNFNLKNQLIPAAKYNELQQYMDNIAKAQNKKLVIKHKAS